MKTFITKKLIWALIPLLYTGISFAQYSNSTLNGHWLLHSGPITTASAEADTDFTYIGFDGNGNITDWENFGPVGGTDSVTPGGAISITLLIYGMNGPSADTIQISGQLISPDYATLGQGTGLSRIIDQGALTDSLVGVLYSPVAGERIISLGLNSDGQIISSTGLASPVSGRVFADSGIFMGHITTGDATMYSLDSLGSSWDEFTIIGPYAHDSLNGVLILDGPRNYDPRGTVSLVRHGTATGVAPAATKDVPEGFRLLQNYPNPFNPTTIISYQLPKDGPVTLEVFDLLGRRVRSLVNGKEDAGIHSVRFDASTLASGVYIYRAQAGSFIQTKKLVIVK